MGSGKGQLAINETFYLIAGIVVCLIIVIFVISLLGGGKGWLDWACKEMPWLCGGESTADERLAAKTSANALACAINYIANGEMGSECDIKEYSSTVARPAGASDYGYPPDLPGGLSFTGNIGAQYHNFITGMATASDLQTNIVCGKGFKVEGERTRNCENCYEICSESGGTKRDCKCAESSRWYTWQDYDCQWVEDDPDQTKPTCLVTSFHLPQKIGATVEWIEGLGDPNFLLYYQSFPQGEDAAWSGYSIWMESSRTLIFLTSCALGAVNIFTARVPGRSIAGEVSEAAARTMSSKVVRLWKWFSKKVLKKEVAGEAAEEATEQLAFEFIRAESRAAATTSGKAAFITRFKSFFSKIPETKAFQAFTSFDTLAKTGVYTGEAAALGITMSEYIDRRIATEFGKFYPVEGKLLLQEPLITTPISETKVFSEVSGASTQEERDSGKPIMDIGRPIILDKESLGEGISPFYLASPCHADLTISMGDVSCSSYTYNDDTESVFCDSPEKPSVMDFLEGSNRMCGVIDDKLLESIMKTKVTGNSDALADIKSVMIEPVASRGTKLLHMETDYLSIKDPVTGYTFEFEYNENWDIVCCEILNDKQWYNSTKCTEDGGNVVDDIECIKSKNDLQLGYPLRIKSITDNTGAPVKDIKPEEIGEWLCVLRDPVLDRGIDGVAFTNEVKSVIEDEEIGFDMDSYSSNMFGIGRYVSCELDSSYWSGTTPEEGKMRKEYPHQESTFGSNLGYSTPIFFMAAVDDDGDFEGMRGIGVAFESFTHMAGEDNMDFASVYSFMDTGNSNGLSLPDGRVDVASLLFGWKEISGMNFGSVLRFTDSDSDGKFDSLEQTNCRVEAVKISADKSQYSKDAGYEHNFCYRDKTVWGYVATVGMFLSDIALQKLLTGASAGLSYVAGVAVDCGFVYVSMKLGHTEWPG